VLVLLRQKESNAHCRVSRWARARARVTVRARVRVRVRVRVRIRVRRTHPETF